MNYCTYLTVYSGNKLPPFYVGYSSIKRINNGYRGSVVSRLYKAIWKEEQKNRPELFRTIITTQHETENEAKAKEIQIQTRLGVVYNPLYVNQSIWPNCFHSRRGAKHTEKAIQKNRAWHLGKPAWNKGKPMSEETKKRISLSKTGKKSGPCPEIRRLAISAAKKGKPNGCEGRVHNDKTREKMRLKALGRTPWNKGKHTNPEKNRWVHNAFFQERRRIHSSLLDEFLEANFGWEAGKGPHW